MTLKKFKGFVTVSRADLERVVCLGCGVPMPESGRLGGILTEQGFICSVCAEKPEYVDVVGVHIDGIK